MARDTAELLTFYGRMALIRRAEERISKLFADGELPGFVHLSIGQEAVAVGVCAAIEDTDTIASTHRGHGHALAKGMSLEPFFAEIMGRATGVCAGRGGSMHVAEMRIGMLGANGIVGGGLAIALGSALAHQVRRTRNVALAFFGDGAMAEGSLHECLNLAKLWMLPLIFVCENNGWSEFSPLDRQFAATLSGLGAAFGIPHEVLGDGDVETVAVTARRLVEAARRGEGPQIMECCTQRWCGHYEGDPQKYRGADNLSAARARDPIVIAARKLAERGIGAKRLRAIEQDIDAQIEAAIAGARRAAEPEFSKASRNVYFDKEPLHG